MDIRIKALVVLLPFIIAGYVGFALLQPVMDEAHTKDNAIGEKRTENDNLELKLKGSSKVSQRQVQLNQEIEKLRDSVPKSPDSDLLTIDLEKMCKEAGMNMIALAPPKDLGNAQPKTKEESTQAKKDKLKNMLKGGPASADTAAEEGGGGGGELEHSTKQFTVSGDYEGLQKLVHELETYQRVVKIEDLTFHLPRKEDAKGAIKIDETPPSDGEDGGDPRLLFITMKLTTYFLP